MRRLGIAAVLALVGVSASALALSPGAGSPPPGLPAAAGSMLLPGAANAVGTHAARWRSDLAVKNPGVQPVEVRVLFLRSGSPNDLATAAHKDYFLMAGETKEFRNVLGTELGLSGTGALLLTTSKAIFPNNPEDAGIQAWMRTATPRLYVQGDAPADAGSPVPPAQPTDAARQLVSGLMHEGFGDQGSRGAVGAVNLSKTQGLTLRIEYFERDGEVLETATLHLPPLGNAQQTVPVRLSSGSARFLRVDGSGPYVAFATNVDNGTGEASFTYAVPEPGQPETARAVVVGGD